MENKRVGILGGSFDPPTLAHEQLGKVFLEALNLDEVRYVLARQNPLKTHDAVGSTYHRWKMLMMMIDGHEKFSASNIEIQDEQIYGLEGKLVNCREPVPSYAYNTLKAFELMEPHTEFIFLGGSDILKNFYQWHQADHLIEEFKIGIAIRPPYSLTATISPVKEEHRSNVTIFDRPPMPDMSSTDIRSHFENFKIEHAKSLMRPDIFDYVVRNRIYEIPHRDIVRE
jgi:nicotinate-nucleotide adenylyltransferase